MPPPSAALRWTDEEHNILVQKANAQIALEEKDSSKVISWSALWQQVAMALEAHGYSRTPGACNFHWKRHIDSQIATEQAAGPRWDDSEHQILLGMTEDQLALESADPSATIPWPQHWKNVSLELKRNGYTRSIEACAAYWDLTENHSFLAVESSNAETQSPEGNGSSGGYEKDGDPPLQHSTEAHPWTDVEHENLARLLSEQRQLLDSNGAEDLFDVKLWTVICRLHQKDGYDRTWEACKTYWEESGKSRDLPENRTKSASIPAVGRMSIESSRSNLSSMWSPVNLFPDNSVTSEPNASEEPASTNPSRIMPQAQMLGNQLPSPISNPTFNSATRTLVSDSEISGINSFQLQGEKEKSMLSEKPQRRKRHRFSVEEKTFLEAEAANNPNPSVKEREEMARHLGTGIEEGTIRNWFLAFRRESRRYQEEITQRTLVMSRFNDRDVSITTEHSPYPPESTPKRTNGSLDTNLSTHDGLASNSQLFKRPRLEPGLSPVNTEQARVESAESQLKQVTVPVSSATAPSSNLSEIAAMPLERPRTAQEPAMNSQSTPICSPAPNIEPIETGTRTIEELDHAVSTASLGRDRSSQSSNCANPIPLSDFATPQPAKASLREDRSSQSSNHTNPMPPSSSATPQQTSTSLTTPTPATTSLATPAPTPTPTQTQAQTPTPTLNPHLPTSLATEKAWAEGKVQSFASEMAQLQQDNAACKLSVQQILQAIEEAEKADQKLHEEEEAELRKLKEKFERGREILRAKRDELYATRASELGKLNRNERTIARTERGMNVMRELVAYHSSLDDGGI